MQLDLESYIKVYPTLDKNVCADLISQLDELDEWTDHTFTSYAEGVSYSTGDDPLYCVSKVDDHDAVVARLYDVLKLYITELNTKWFRSWSGFTAPKYIKYKSNNKMENHCDHIRDIFDGERKGIPILTMICALNDQFTGGDLVFFGDHKVDLKVGDVAIFPSNFLYPHKITSINEGTRYSLASWVW